MMHLPNEALILFQGDSITAAGREWAADMHLGDGYVRIIARWRLGIALRLTSSSGSMVFLNV